MVYRGSPPQSGRDMVARVQGREAAEAPGYVQADMATRDNLYSLTRPFPSVGGWKPPLLGLRRFPANRIQQQHVIISETNYSEGV